MRSEGAEVVVSDTLDSYLDVKLMESRDLIVQIWTMGTITNEQEAGLLKAVKNGAGLAGWHGGIGDSFRNNVEYQFMVGGQWVAHPGGVIGYSVQITNHEDPVTKGSRISICTRNSTTCISTPMSRCWPPQNSTATTPLDRRVCHTRGVEKILWKGKGILLLIGPRHR